VSGQPAASLPLHRTPGGLPSGPARRDYGREDVLLRVSSQLEEASGGWTTADGSMLNAPMVPLQGDSGPERRMVTICLLLMAHRLSHLDTLASEAIHIIREVVAEFERPALLFSGGKDSAVLLHLATKACWPSACRSRSCMWTRGTISPRSSSTAISR